MKFTLDAVLLWPVNPLNPLRRIAFAPDKVNIVHGLSGSGKSSIVQVIDYVLGASKCQIPIGRIRQKVQWFGLHVTLGQQRWVIARASPNSAATSGDYYLAQADSPPMLPVANSNLRLFREQFNAMTWGSAGEPHPGSYRDVATLNFLPQHIVANPNTLFSRIDTWTHKERFTRALPYALGMVDGRYVHHERQRKQAVRERDALNKQLALIEKTQGHWQRDVERMLDRCVELGLLSPDVPGLLTDQVARLQSVVDAYASERLENALLASNRLKSNERFAQALAKESAQHDRVNALIADIRGYDDLARSSQRYTQAIAVEKTHVIGLDWLKSSLVVGGHCVACAAPHPGLDRVIDSLQEKVNQASRISDVLQNNPLVDKHLAVLKRTLASEEKKLDALRTEKNQVLAQDKALKNTLGQIYFLAGDISGLLNRLSQTAPDPSVQARIKVLEQEIHDHDKAMALSNRATREREIDDTLSTLIGEYADLFGGLEGPVGSHLTLDRKELTLRFDRPGHKSDYLWEVGSGANWMGYHIATFLALHEYLSQPGQQHLPPLGFLVIDQPSQVYFPSTTAGDNQLDDDFNTLKIHRTADVIATRRIFEVLSAGLKRTGFNLQIIVLEHAGPDIWHDIAHTHSVQAWRTKGDGLIPADWQ